MKNSDKNSTLENLKDQVAGFCEERGWDKAHNPKDLAIGAVTEASELLEIFRFQSEKQSLEMLKDEKTRQSIGEELADTLYFILRFAQLYQLDMTNCLKDKLAKNAIKYPVNKK